MRNPEVDIRRSEEVNHEARSGTPWRSRTFQMVLAVSLTGVMGVSLISPVLPELRNAFGVTDSQVGLVITFYTLPGALLAPFAGLAADRFGRRRVIIPLLFIFGIAGAGIAFTESFRAVLALRFFQGIGASVLVTLAVTLIGDLWEGNRRAAAMGANGSVIASGAALYPFLGGLLATIRWNLPFVFFGVSILLGLIALVVLEEPDTGRTASFRDYLAEIRSTIFSPKILAINASILLVFLLFYGAILTAMPLLLSDEFALGTDAIGILLSLVAIASGTISLLYGHIARRWGPFQLISIGFLCYGVGMVGIWAAQSVLLIGVWLLLFGAGFGFVMPSIDLAIAKIAPEDLRAGTMGVRTSMLRIGQTAGPLVFTIGAEAWFRTTVVGYRTLVLVSGLLSVAIGVGAYGFLRYKSQKILR